MLPRPPRLTSSIFGLLLGRLSNMASSPLTSPSVSVAVATESLDALSVKDKDVASPAAVVVEDEEGRHDGSAKSEHHQPYQQHQHRHLQPQPNTKPNHTGDGNVAADANANASNVNGTSSSAITEPLPSDKWPSPYYLEDDLRRVAPYHFTYNTWCKERWRNRPLIEIFESEFRDRPLAYYRAAMESGTIFVNGSRVGPDYIVRNGDKISHKLHRHEPPVTADPIGVIHEDDSMIVINKPAGVPVHPAGRYNFNSITEIMKAERGPSFLPYPCNRLDRLTSGIMFIGKSQRGAEALGVQIKGRTVRKEYIARVIGRFPDGEVVCDQPILAISPKLGLNRVRANGKAARTVFKRLAYYPPREEKGGAGEAEAAAGTEEQQAKLVQELGADPGKGRPWLEKKGYSIVRCLPVTGRTHQLRVHLQHLGHPIQNDPIYANQRVWGMNLGEADIDGSQTTDDDVISRLSRMGKEEVAQAVVYYDEMVDMYEKRRAERMTGELCDICQTPLYSDPGSHELSLWLHSLRYEDAGGSWSYTSPLPQWALPPKGMSGPTTVGGMEELVEAVKDKNPEIS